MEYFKNWSLAIGATALLAACGGGDGSPPAAITQALQNTASTNVDAALCTDNALATGAYQWVGVQCTLASALLSGPVVTKSQSSALVSRAATSAAASSTVATIDVTAFLDWAEATFPTLFPGHKTNILSNPIVVYRYYPETQIAVGVSEGKVYGVGPVTGNQLVLLGNLSDFTCQVSPSLCAAPGAPTIGTATAGEASASISFTAPTASSSLTVTAYTATCTAGTSTKTGTATASPVTVSGLTNGTSYSCSVKATNSAGTGSASAAVAVTPVAASTGGTSGTTSTAGVQCNYSYNALNTTASVNKTSTASWTCSSTSRLLSANGLPDHDTGTFPNSNNPNTITAQTVAATYTLTPAVVSTTGTAATIVGYGLNGVKFDPATAGSCNDSGSNCTMIGSTGNWRIEALTQKSFNFGTDTNNAHVQPTGEYHYHGMPEGLVTKQNKGTAMTLIGWAADGFPIYARYGYTKASDASSGTSVLKGSYQTKATASANRPSTLLYAMGTFIEDWEYVAGSGDLDECNGRTGVTPEFPNGIYHYYATDTYPFLQRCVKGTAATGGGTGGGMTPPPPRG